MDKFDALIVVDAQNDFVTGSLATPGAAEIVPKIAEYIAGFRSKRYSNLVVFTRDTHFSNYFGTLEGKHIPTAHCMMDTLGWCIVEELRNQSDYVINKTSFALDWETFFGMSESKPHSIELVGFCTDICVLVNALVLRQQYPNVPIRVHKDLCAGTSKEAHEAALLVMKQCLIEVV